MIGLYDSGVGGLATWKYFQSLFPQYEYNVLADNAIFPLGEKTAEQIKENTFKALVWFFEQGATLVIIACNTAAAHTVRAWQSQYPEKKVLSITVPGIEELINYQKNLTTSSSQNTMTIGVLATKSTIFSGIYSDLFTKLGGAGSPDFEFIISSDLIRSIEMSGASAYTEQLIEKYCKQFKTDPDILVLGCTHFSLVKPLFEKYFEGIIIDPSQIAAKKFKEYLTRHPDIEQQIYKSGATHFYTTSEKIYSPNFEENIDFTFIHL